MELQEYYWENRVEVETEEKIAAEDTRENEMDETDIDRACRKTTGDILLNHNDIRMFARMSPEELKQDKRRPRIIQMYEDMQSEKDYIRERGEQNFIAEIEGLIKSVIDKNFGKYSRQYGADMLQEGISACFENRYRFDPDKGAFSTYFTYAATTGIQTYVRQYIKEETRHEGEVDGKVLAAIRELSKDIDEKDITDEQIQQLTGYSMKVLQASLTRIRRSVPLGLDDTLVTAKSDPTTNPAVAYAKEEEKREFWKIILKNVSEKESQLLMMIAEGKNLKEISVALCISHDEAQNMKDKVMKRLAKSGDLRDFAGMPKLTTKSKHREEIAFIEVENGTFFDEDEAN